MLPVWPFQWVSKSCSDSLIIIHLVTLLQSLCSYISIFYLYCFFHSPTSAVHRRLPVDVSQDPRQPWNVDTSLTKFFQKKRVELRCNKCPCHLADETIKITKKPKALIVSFQRFVNAEAGTDGMPDQVLGTAMARNNVEVELQPTLSLESFVSTREDEEREVESEEHEYEAVATVQHLGQTATSGHYTANTLRNVSSESAASERRWVCFNDTLSEYMSESIVFESEKRKKEVYLAVYSAKDDKNEREEEAVLV